MKYLISVYAVLCIAGLVIGHLGVSLLAVACGVFFYWADKEMDKPPPARLKSTLEVLDEYCCECCNPNSPRQVSFPESKY